MADEKEKTERASQRPYFIWDYDLTEEDVRAILRGDNEYEKVQMMVRILERCSWSDIWNYLSLGQVHRYWSQIRPKIRRELRPTWELAMKVWYGGTA
ncbi:MAG: hypothetical protein M1482_13905 [Chloroflexi bacterium]|nr:hypothetical protein [Chloroflexota bacterium]